MQIDFTLFCCGLVTFGYLAGLFAGYINHYFGFWKNRKDKIWE